MVMSTMLIWFLEFLPHFFVGKLILNWTTAHILLKWVETQPPTCQQVMIFECFVSMRRYPGYLNQHLICGICVMRWCATFFRGSAENFQ